MPPLVNSGYLLIYLLTAPIITTELGLGASHKEQPLVHLCGIEIGMVWYTRV